MTTTTHSAGWINGSIDQLITMNTAGKSQWHRSRERKECVQYLPRDEVSSPFPPADSFTVRGIVKVLYCTVLYRSVAVSSFDDDLTVSYQMRVVGLWWRPEMFPGLDIILLVSSDYYCQLQPSGERGEYHHGMRHAYEAGKSPEFLEMQRGSTNRADRMIMITIMIMKK